MHHRRTQRALLNLSLSNGTLTVVTEVERVSGPATMVEDVYFRENTLFFSLQNAEPLAALSLSDDEQFRAASLEEYLREIIVGGERPATDVPVAEREAVD